MNTPRAQSNPKGALFGFLAFSLFAMHDVVIKFLGGSYAVVQVIFFSTLFAFPLLLILLAFDRTQANLRPVHPAWLALRAGISVPVMICIFYAFTALKFAETYTILFTTPLFVTALSVPILKEKVGPRRWAAVLVGFAGVIVVLQPGTTELSLGHLSGLAGAFGAAVTFTVMRKIGGAERTVVMMFYPNLVTLIAMSVVLPFVYQPMPLSHFGANALMSALGFTAAICVLAAYRRAPAVVVAPTQYSQIVLATLFGALFFGESLDSNVAIGAAIIIASGIYIVFRENRLS
jgi:drug/metabolite transporter (DMT)-like permease